MKTTANKTRRILDAASWCLIAACMLGAAIVAPVSFLAAASLTSAAATTYLLLD